MIKLMTTVALLAACAAAHAQSTPVGLWKTIDDQTKQEKSYVRLTESGGVVGGKIERLVDPTRQDAVCDKCDGARQGQKIVGMQIVEGLKKNPDAAVWEGGTILDPNEGKTYKVKMTPKDGGKTLEVRGYIGAPMFGRTQVWTRVE